MAKLDARYAAWSKKMADNEATMERLDIEIKVKAAKGENVDALKAKLIACQGVVNDHLVEAINIEIEREKLSTKPHMI